MNHVVTVTFVAWQRKEALKRGIESTLIQTYKEIEILVLDNSPTDEIYRWLLDEYPHVKSIKTAHPIALPAARNILVATAKGKYVFFHDDDSRFSDSHDVEKAVNYIESHPNVACLAFRVGDGQGNVNPQFEVESPTPGYNYIACATLFHRLDFIAAGYYFEDFWIYGEELVMSIGFFGLGKEIHVLPEVFIIHQYESIGRAKDNWKRYWKSEIIMKPGTFLMKFPLPDALFYYFGLLFFSTFQVAIIRAKLFFALTSFIEALAFLPIFIQKRSSISKENAQRWLKTRAEYQQEYYKRTNQWNWFRKFVPVTR